MKITDDHVAALRAQLNAEVEEFQRRADLLKSDPNVAGFNALLAAAFFLEMERRFSSEQNAAGAIITFVGEVRAQFDSNGEWLDPVLAENLIRHVVLGDREIDDIDAKTGGGLQTALLTASIRERGLSPDQIDAFLADVRQLAEA